MAEFQFSFSGRISVDEEALGVSVANSFQPSNATEKDTEILMHLRLDPAKSLEVLVTRAFCEAMMRDFGPDGWRDLGLSSQAIKVQE